MKTTTRHVVNDPHNQPPSECWLHLLPECHPLRNTPLKNFQTLLACGRDGGKKVDASGWHIVGHTYNALTRNEPTWRDKYTLITTREIQEQAEKQFKYTPPEQRALLSESTAEESTPEPKDEEGEPEYREGDDTFEATVLLREVLAMDRRRQRAEKLLAEILDELEEHPHVPATHLVDRVGTWRRKLQAITRIQD